MGCLHSTSRSTPAPLLALLYLAFGSIAIVLLLLVVPPYQVGDESSHFSRADQLSRGEIFGYRVARTSGGLVSEGIDASAAPYYPLVGRPEAKVTPEMIARGARATWANSAVSPTVFHNTVMYPPFLYLPAIAGILAGKASGFSVVNTLTLSRAIAGIVSVLICAGAIAIAGGAAPFLFVVLSLPMSLFQMASVSQDGPLIALAALAGAIFCGARDRDAMPVAAFATMCASIAVVAMARPPYAVLAVLALLSSWRSWAARCVAITAILASVAIWVHLVAPLAPFTAAPGAVPATQISAMIADPLQILWIFGRSLTVGMLDTFVGRLGWLDTRLPLAFIVIAVLMLIVGWIASAGSLRKGPSGFAATMIVAAAIGGFSLIMVIQFVMWTAPGMIMVAGMQGRYLIPLVLLLAAAIPADPMLRNSPMVVRCATIAVVIFMPSSIIVMIAALLQRYY